VAIDDKTLTSRTHGLTNRYQPAATAGPAAIPRFASSLVDPPGAEVHLAAAVPGSREQVER